jgi:hypothetical protein
MATIVTRAGKGSALTWTEGDANFTNLNNDKIEAVSDDLTPALGGDLDVGANSITTTTVNGDITLAPNGTGIVIAQGDLEVGYGTGTAAITSAGAYNLDLVTNGGTNSGVISITAGANGNIAITPNGTGKINLDGQQWPNADGTNGQVLSTNGSGTLSWTTPSTFNPASPGAIGGTTPSTGTFTTLTLNATGEMRFADTDSSNYVGFKAPGTVSANKIWTLPATDGTSGQLLSTNGSGVLSWVNDSTGGGGGSVTAAVLNLNYLSSTNVATNTWRLGITEQVDPGNIITISSNAFSLAAGTYLVTNSGWVRSTTSGNLRLYLRNTSDSTNALTWYHTNVNYSGGTQNLLSIGTQGFTIASTKNFAIWYEHSGGQQTPNDTSGDNTITIVKIA